MKASELTKKYFDLSNGREFERIEQMMQQSATYSSDTTGLHFGRDNVMKMMRDFFNMFDELHWETQSIADLSEHIAEVNFKFEGIKKDGTEISRRGIEHIVVENDLIRHIEVRNKAAV